VEENGCGIFYIIMVRGGGGGNSYARIGNTKLSRHLVNNLGNVISSGGKVFCGNFVKVQNRNEKEMKVWLPHKASGQNMK
jgi:hypothetical protein